MIVDSCAMIAGTDNLAVRASCCRKDMCSPRRICDMSAIVAAKLAKITQLPNSIAAGFFRMNGIGAQTTLPAKIVAAP